MEEEGLLDRRSRELEAERGGGAVTPMLIFSTCVAVCGAFSSGCAIGYSSPTQSAITKELGLTTAEYSLFGSMLTIGGIIGAVLCGRLTDVLGRRATLWLLDIFCISGWLVIVLAKNVWWLDIGRLCLGLGTGLQTYVSTVYIVEIAPKDIRGGFAMATQLTVSGGVALMFSIGNVITWRTLALIGAIPCLFQVIGLIFMPESPRWLARVGRHGESERILQSLRGKGVVVSQEAAEIKYCTEASQQSAGSSFLKMFQWKYARPLIVVFGLAFLLPLAGGNGILFYASSIFETSGFSVSIGTTGMALIQIPFSVLGILLMDRWGRKAFLMVDLAGACLGSFLAGLAFLLQDLDKWKELAGPLVLVGIMVYFAVFSLGAGLPFVIMSEILPLDIKGTAGSLAAFVTQLSSLIVAYAFNILFNWNSAGVFFICASICGSTIVFAAKMLPETKGLSLEEIEASMIHPQHVS